jgi:hypothetical protein
VVCAKPASANTQSATQSSIARLAKVSESIGILLNEFTIRLTDRANRAWVEEALAVTLVCDNEASSQTSVRKQVLVTFHSQQLIESYDGPERRLMIPVMLTRVGLSKCAEWLSRKRGNPIHK